MKIFSFYSLLFLACSLRVSGQPEHYSTANAHAHNDYEHALPFYDAYARHFGSIEADVWAVDGKLFVAHNRSKIKPERTFKKLYLEPLIHRIAVNNGKPYKNGDHLQLLIDLKSPYYEVMPLLKQDIEPYEKYFDISHNPNAVRIVISGSKPPPDSLHFYERVFTFDGRLGSKYPPEDLNRVKLVSINVRKLVPWRGNTTLSVAEQQVLKRVIDSIHSQGKMIRFWATPNTLSAYQMLVKLGVDYIGTDNLPLLECFLRKQEKGKQG